MSRDNLIREVYDRERRFRSASELYDHQVDATVYACAGTVSSNMRMKWIIIWGTGINYLEIRTLAAVGVVFELLGGNLNSFHFWTLDKQQAAMWCEARRNPLEKRGPILKFPTSFILYQSTYEQSASIQILKRPTLTDSIFRYKSAWYNPAATHRLWPFTLIGSTGVGFPQV
jgi:hypothetical protein